MFRTRKGMAVAAAGIVLAAALVLLGVTGRVTRTVVSESGVAYEQKVDSVAFGFQLRQGFVPQYGRLDAVKVHVDTSGCAKDAGELQVSILGEGGGQAAFTSIPISELPQYGWVEARVNARLAPGKAGTLVLESVGCADNGPKITFLDSRLAASKEQKGQGLVYAGMDVEHSALKISFIYSVPIKMYEYLVYYVFGMMLVLMLAYAGCEK